MRDKKYLFLLPVVIAGAWFATQAFPPERGPHNGIVKPADGFYIEAGYNSSEIFAYLLDSTMKPIRNDGITCIAIIEFPDKTTGNLDLYPYGEEGFGAPNIQKDYTTCTIIFEKDGRKVSAEFPNESLVVINETKQ